MSTHASDFAAFESFDVGALGKERRFTFQDRMQKTPEAIHA